SLNRRERVQKQVVSSVATTSVSNHLLWATNGPLDHCSVFCAQIETGATSDLLRLHRIPADVCVPSSAGRYVSRGGKVCRAPRLPLSLGAYCEPTQAQRETRQGRGRQPRQLRSRRCD